MQLASLVYGLALIALLVHAIAAYLAFTEAYRLPYHRRVWLLFAVPPFLLVCQGLSELLDETYLTNHAIHQATLSLSLALILTTGVFFLRSLLRDVAEKTAALEFLSRMDGLTGLLRRDAWSAAVERELALARRDSQWVTVIEIDVDHFKSVNDRYGHEEGDEVLRVLGDLCQRSTRQTDLWGRLGGEEFVCLMPNTQPNQALELVERLRGLVADHFFATGYGGIQITISLGLTSVQPSQSPESCNETLLRQLIKEADDAMYEAKRTGRNRCCTSDQVAKP